MNTSQQRMAKVKNLTSMPKTVFTARHVTSKIPVKTLIGSILREAVGRPTMECERSSAYYDGSQF